MSKTLHKWWWAHLLAAIGICTATSAVLVIGVDQGWIDLDRSWLAPLLPGALGIGYLMLMDEKIHK